MINEQRATFIILSQMKVLWLISWEIIDNNVDNDHHDKVAVINKQLELLVTTYQASTKNLKNLVSSDCHNSSIQHVQTLDVSLVSHPSNRSLCFPVFLHIVCHVPIIRTRMIVVLVSVVRWDDIHQDMIISEQSPHQWSYYRMAKFKSTESL